MNVWYDPEGRPCSMESWGQFMNDPEMKYVKQETVNGYYVSTVYIGLNYRFGDDGPPLIYETMIFEGGDWSDLYCERYHSRLAAEAGHERAVEHARQGFLLDDNEEAP